MKRSLLLLVAVCIASSAFSQLNIVSTNQLKSQTSQGGLQVLGKPDFNIDKYFKPYEAYSSYFEFKPEENSVGCKLYIHDVSPKYVYLCVNHNDKTYTLKQFEKGYYEITRIIRFRDQLDQILAYTGHKTFVEKGEYNNRLVIKKNPEATNKYRLIENDSIYYGVDSIINYKWHRSVTEEFISKRAFEKRALVKNNITYNKGSIYELTDENNISYYVPIDHDFNNYDINYRVGCIDKAYYKISEVIKRKKVVRVDTVKLLARERYRERYYHLRNDDYLYHGEGHNLHCMSMPFYDSLCSRLKGKDVLIMFNPKTEFFTDPISQETLKAPQYQYSWDISRAKPFHFIAKKEKDNYEYDENKWSYPELHYSKCLDIVVSENISKGKHKIYGLFEAQGARFYLSIDGYPNAYYSLDTRYPGNHRLFYYNYYSSGNDYGRYRIVPRQNIENIRQEIEGLVDKWRQTAKEYQLAQEKRLAKEKQQWELEKQQRRERLINMYGEEFGVMIAERKVAIGMTKAMCREAWGRPDDIYNTTTSHGSSSIWTYGLKSNLFFDDDKLVSIQN